MPELIRECDIHGPTFDDVRACTWEGETLFLCDRCSTDIHAIVIGSSPFPSGADYYQFKERLAAERFVSQRVERGPLADATDEVLNMIICSVWHPLQEEAHNEFRRRHPIELRR